jgi:hypothetical protein
MTPATLDEQFATISTKPSFSMEKRGNQNHQFQNSAQRAQRQLNQSLDNF